MLVKYLGKSLCFVVCSFPIILLIPYNVFSQTTYPTTKSYQASTSNGAKSNAQDQDDMAIWVHPSDPSLSTVIGSDKGHDLYVYQLDGTTIQTITPPGSTPGNIDVRYNFSLGGQRVDIVAHNRRDGGDQIVVYKVNSDRTLTRIDDNTITTAPNYGFCLYHSPIDGKFYGFATSSSGKIEQ